MRTALKKVEGTRYHYTATFSRYGTKPGWNGNREPTILLVDVKSVVSGEQVASHLWFNSTKEFQTLGMLYPGDIIQFCAKSSSYVKGYQGHKEDVFKPVMVDYALTRPTKIKKVRKEGNPC